MGVALAHDLPKNRDAPALARDAMRGLYGYLPHDLVEDATLLVSELVTNGDKYGGDGRLRLEVDARPQGLHAEIVDQGSGFEPLSRARRDLDPTDEGGWGLHLVDELADEWGVYEGSTHVWFELKRAA